VRRKSFVRANPNRATALVGSEKQADVIEKHPVRRAHRWAIALKRRQRALASVLTRQEVEALLAALDDEAPRRVCNGSIQWGLSAIRPTALSSSRASF